jgi:hypothetical protein
MSPGVTQPANSAEPSLTAETGAALPPGLFTAFQEKPTRRLGLRIGLLVGTVVLLGFVGNNLLRREQLRPYRLINAQGNVKTVYNGMSAQQVDTIMGVPLTRETLSGMECFQYGRPTLKDPTFLLFSICYVDGKVETVKARRFNSWVVSPNGTMAPAPAEELPLEEALDQAVP